MRLLLFLILISLLLNGCKGATEQIKETNRPQPVISKDLELEKWREAIKRDTYIIDVPKTPNPFINLKILLKPAGKEEITPLELVGIVAKNGFRMAILQDTFKKGYIVKKGDKLGNILIRDIGDDYLLIEETIRSPEGLRVKDIRKITLKKER